MNLIFNNIIKTKSGKGVYQMIDGLKYFVSFETLNDFDINKNEATSSYIIITDDSKPIHGKTNWKFMNPINIERILIDESLIEEFKKERKKEASQLEIKFESTIFEDENNKNEENSRETIDWDSIYDNLKSYEIIEKPNRKMNQINKLVQKSIKLTKRKYFNIPPNVSNITYSLLKSLTMDNIDAWLKGDVESIKIQKPSMPKIPLSLKDDKESIISWVKNKLIGMFITQSDEKQYLKGSISLSEILTKAIGRAQTKFNKISSSYSSSKMLKRKTGINPFVIAWPFMKGKTNTGVQIHSPLAYREIKIKESLDTYEIFLSHNFIVNTYPILKNYESTNHQVNEIIPEHDSLESLLQEFFKHGIKIGRPASNIFIDYSDIGDSEASKWISNNFELSNEVILRMKLTDEFIYYDLRNIIKKGKEFAIPLMTKRFIDDELEKSKSSKYINDVDLSKSIAIDSALNGSSVIYGPPGTGKSATITAFIGKIIEGGYNSLFVAEKATAIEVIEKNLKKINFDCFVLNLNNDSKIDFTEKFNKLVQIISSNKYIEYKNIKEIDFAKKWLEENEKRHFAINEVVNHYGINFENLEKLIEIKNVSQINLSELKHFFQNKLLLETTKIAKKDSIYKINEFKKKIKKQQDLIDRKIVVTLDTLNGNNSVKIMLKTKSDILKLANADSVTAIGTLVSNSVFRAMLSGWREKSISSLKSIWNIARIFKEEIDKNEIQIKNFNESLNTLNENLESNMEIIERYENASFDELLIYEEVITNLDKNAIKFIDDNWDEIISFDENSWKKMNKEKKNQIALIREITINNYSVRMKELLKEKDNGEKLLRLKGFIENKLNRRSNSIPLLFADGSWELLIKVFPAVMMNPNYVAKIFPSKEDIFDYAIFDEASQIRLHRAMPAIHRAKNLLVAGDDKQLGPTDVFTNLDREEDESFNINEDMSLNNSTLLNFAKDKYKSVQLNTHYRSKAKDLIKFSNENFYGGKIMIGDSPNPSFDGKSPILVEELGGKWTSGYTNLKEATRAVELIKYYMHLNQSIGVITFNDPQKALINNMCMKDEELRIFVQSDSYFLKSIKDVQGDEMDVIIFSIAYGKREQSNTYVKSFGQFSKEKINVAITRSRKRIHVLKSLPSLQVDAVDDDKRIFKRWLEFLESYKSEEFDPSLNAGEPVNSFEEDYLKEMKSFLGEDMYEVYSNYKTAGKEIDVVIYDKNKKRFLGAIELDGAKWHSSTDAVLQDYERQVFLENMGWKFVRTGFHNFYNNRQKCVEKNFDSLLEMNDQRRNWI